MDIKTFSALIALIKEILRHPEIKKHNTKKNRVKNILLVCFLLMFFGFAVMTEQAVLQSTAKHELQNEVTALKKQVEELKLDLYVKQLSEQ